MTTASVIDAVNYRRDIPLNPLLQYKIFYKDGGDGAGSQCVWKSKSMQGALENMFQYSVVPLRLECLSENQNDEPNVVWQNPSPNSATWCRPLYLIRMKEDDVVDDVVDVAVKSTDQSREFMNTESSIIIAERSENTAYQVDHHISDTMKDLKFKKPISGLGGADCLLCKYQQNEWMDIKQIWEGFPITRTAGETLATYNQLRKEGYKNVQGITNREGGGGVGVYPYAKDNI